MPVHIARRAIVVGAGMAGLTAARAAADFFEEVLILERDVLAPEPRHRAGTPQDRHTHAILGGGQRALSELFPAFEHDLIRVGAAPWRAGLELRIDRPGYDPFPQRDLGWVSYGISRPLIELLTRHRVNQCDNVTVRHCVRALQLAGTADGRVTGIWCETEEGSETLLPAELVIDATGRGGLTLDFLRANRFPLPEEEAIGMNAAYATAVFDIPDDAPSDWKGVRVFPAAPQSSRFAVMLPQEGGRWTLSTGELQGDAPPCDHDGFLDYVRGLRTPTIHDAVRHARRIGEIRRFRLPASIRRRFERLNAFPRGLLVLGDAVCRFSPAYGQGMSVAAQEACALQGLLDRRAATGGDPFNGLAQAFFANIQPIVDGPWMLASLDFVYPRTEGLRPPDFTHTLRFMQALLCLAAHDPLVHRLVQEVQDLLRPISAYRDPGLADRVRAIMDATTVTAV